MFCILNICLKPAPKRANIFQFPQFNPSRSTWLQQSAFQDCTDKSIIINMLYKMHKATIVKDIKSPNDAASWGLWQDSVPPLGI